MKVENCDVVIVGSGVAGLICALSLDKNFKPRKNSVYG